MYLLISQYNQLFIINYTDLLVELVYFNSYTKAINYLNKSFSQLLKIINI